MPLTITLRLNKFYYFLLFSLNACLLFPKSIKLCMFLSYLFAMLIGIQNSGVRIFIPNIQYRYTNIPAKIKKRILIIQYYLFLIIFRLNIIQLRFCMSQQSILITLGPFFLIHRIHIVINYLLILFINFFLVIIVDILTLVLCSLSNDIRFMSTEKTVFTQYAFKFFKVF